MDIMKLTIAFSIIFFYGTTVCALSQEQSPSIPANQETIPNGRKYVPKQEIPFEQAIMVLGFEKTLSSKKESLLIQNRTQETVTRIKLRIVYKTPQNEMLDYREIFLDKEILPGMTKKFSINSFDENRQYYYYMTPPTGKSIESSYPFKITFTLLRYDIAITR